MKHILYTSQYNTCGSVDTSNGITFLSVWVFQKHETRALSYRHCICTLGQVWPLGWQTEATSFHVNNREDNCGSVCVDYGWFEQPHPTQVRLIGLWGWLRLHAFCTLSNQCVQVKPAIYARTFSWKSSPGNLPSRQSPGWQQSTLAMLIIQPLQ